ncbi:MAG: hypothetical protein R2712_16885 [Vicinamibacterales bacterium]
MTLAGYDVRLAVRSLRRSPLFAAVAILSLALGIGANTAIFTLIDQTLLRQLPVKNPDELVMLYQQGPHNGSNMGQRMHSYPIYQEYQQRGEPLAGARAAPRGLHVDQRRRGNRTRGRRDGVGQLLHDAGRAPRRRTRLQLGGGRPRVPRPPGRRPELRLLDAPLRGRSRRGRPEGARQQLPDDGRGRVGGRLLGPGPRPLARHPHPDPDEARRRARVGLVPDGQPTGALGAGVRAAQARLHGGVGTGSPAGALHAGPHLRVNAREREELDAVRARAVPQEPLLVAPASIRFSPLRNDFSTPLLV